MSEPTLTDAARRELDDLLQQIARSIAHEANNLLFIEEILAKTPSAGRGGGGGELRRGIEQMRQDAKLISHILGNVGKPVALSVGALIDQVVSALGKQSSLREAILWDAPEPVRALCLRERPGHVQIILQRLCEHNAVRASGDGTRYGFVVSADEDAITFAMRPSAAVPLPHSTALARELASRSGLAMHEDEAGIRLMAPLA